MTFDNLHSTFRLYCAHPGLAAQAIVLLAIVVFVGAGVFEIIRRITR